jgi:hypothetical protein
MKEGTTFFGKLKSTDEDFVLAKVDGSTFVMPRYIYDSLGMSHWFAGHYGPWEKKELLNDSVIPPNALQAATVSSRKIAKLTEGNSGCTWVSA